MADTNIHSPSQNIYSHAQFITPIFLLQVGKIAEHRSIYRLYIAYALMCGAPHVRSSGAHMRSHVFCNFSIGILSLRSKLSNSICAHLRSAAFSCAPMRSLALSLYKVFLTFVFKHKKRDIFGLGIYSRYLYLYTISPLLLL